MTRDQLHNIIVQAFAKGVEASLAPMPAHINLTKENMVGQVQAYLNGKAIKLAEEICSSPTIIMSLD